MGSTGKYILMNDIDLSGVEWTAKKLNAGAEFNGNGYAVSNMVTSGTSSYQGGLFGANSGTIKNLKVTDAVISGRRDLGILAATNSGLIENCFVSGSISATQEYVGGLVAFNNGEIKYSDADVVLDGANLLAGLVSQNTGTIESSSSRGEINATGGVSGSLVARNQGIIKNSSTIANITIGGGFVGNNSGTIENASASGNVIVNGSGFVGTNSGTIRNATASGNVTGTGYNGGFVGTNSGANALIENCSASGNVSGTGYNTGGFVGYASGKISNSYALGSVNSSNFYTGGFAGTVSNVVIANSYAKGDVYSEANDVGGFVGHIGSGTSIMNCYATGNASGDRAHVHAFTGNTGQQNCITSSYATGTANGNLGDFGAAVKDNCYVLSDDVSKIGTTVNGLTYQSADWFEDGQNLMFLGNAYDYYYNPPELWGNYEIHPEEFTQFQVGANSGDKNTLNMNMTFRMYDFYGDVSSVDAASATLDRVDAFKERLSEHRSMIGAVRNRLDSVLESQSIRLENLNSSHSTIVDTDFASEAATLTRNQILQQATTSLLAQANVTQQLALQLLQ